MMQTITHVQGMILQSLACYKFLTTSQLRKLGVMAHAKSLNAQIRKLREAPKPMVASLNFGVFPKKGKLESVHYLTAKGKEALVTHLGYEANEIRLPVGTNTLFHQDYFHRRHTVDAHIALNQWAAANSAEVEAYWRYFDKLGDNRKNKNLRASTKIPLREGHLIPDSAYRMRLHDGTEVLNLVEVYDGKDARRTVGQLKKHAEAMAEGGVGAAFDYRGPYFVLCLFEFSALRQAAMQRLQGSRYFAHTRAYFRFKDLDELHAATYPVGWKTADGREALAW